MMKSNIFVLLLCFTFMIANVNKVYAEQDYTERVFISGYGQVTVVDPKIPKVKASIEVEGPVRDMSFTANGQKALVVANSRTTLYVIDTLNNKVIKEIELTGRTDKGLLDRRVWGSAISPDGTKAYVNVTQGEKRTNIFKSLPNKILEIDLETERVLRSVEAPYGIHALLFKQDDSNTIFAFGYDIFKLDIEKMTLTLQEGVKHPENPDKPIGNYLNIWTRENTGFNSMPVFQLYPNGKVTEGILWFNLKTAELKTVEFDKPPVGMFSAVIDPQERYGYVILNHWYKVDLNTGHVIKDRMAPTGSIYAINRSANGKKLYLGAGGNSFIVANTDLEVEESIKVPTDGWDIKVVKIQK